MSILKVDTINEKTSGNGVAIDGHIIQTQINHYTGTFFDTTSTSFTTVVSVNITPKFSNSKILITTGGVLYKNNNADGSTGAGFFTVHRNDGALANSTTWFEQNSSTRHWSVYTSGNAAYHIYPHFWQMYDEPNTTSQVTYQFKIAAVTSGNLFGVYRGASIKVEELKG